MCDTRTQQQLEFWRKPKEKKNKQQKVLWACGLLLCLQNRTREGRDGKKKKIYQTKKKNKTKIKFLKKQTNKQQKRL